MTTTNGVSEWPPELVEARRALLDALDALEPHLDSLVLIGAQAIYLHTGTGTLVTPPSTTDADLALDADLLGEEPLIPSALQSAGFALGPHGQPGHWLNVRGIAVDLMVAPHQSGRRKGTARSVSLPPHPRTTARIGPGLAAALRDNAYTPIRSLDPEDTRTHALRVAGPAALLVAKTIKVQDRLADAARGHGERVVEKDALDIFRLLETVPAGELVAGLTQHRPGTPAYDDVRRALLVLRDEAAARDARLPALVLAASHDPVAPPSMVALVEELLRAVDP